MKSVTVTERHALIALGIFVAAVVAYFWYKNQVSSAYSQGLNDELTGLGFGINLSNGSLAQTA